jgi:hypothetical protein
MTPRRSLALTLASVVALVACGGSSLPLPVTGPHVGEDSITVPTVPPPGKVEVIPPPPAKLKSPVWIDGEWEWANGRHWQWKDGRWEEPMPDGYYAPPKTVRLSDGSLVHFNGTWKKGKPSK